MVRVETPNQAAISSSVHCNPASFSSSLRSISVLVPRSAKIYTPFNEGARRFFEPDNLQTDNLKKMCASNAFPPCASPRVRKPTRRCSSEPYVLRSALPLKFELQVK
jgi:hypothetical protein